MIPFQMTFNDPDFKVTPLYDTVPETVLNIVTIQYIYGFKQTLIQARRFE